MCHSINRGTEKILYKEAGYFNCVCTVVLLICVSGCITPHVRYTRPSRSGERAETVDTHTRQSAGEQPVDTQSKLPQSRLKEIVDSYLGVPHRFGGTTRRGMDCSGFVWRVYTDLGYKDFKRTSSARMSRLGRRVSLRKAQPGNLVFFKKWMRINHVGIYMGENTFAHVSSKQGVAYTSLDHEYFSKRLVCIRRIY